jgi:lipid A 3-O-deacylase
MKRLILAAFAAAAVAEPADAAEIFGGVYKHAVNTPLSIGGGQESGLDLQLGYRGASLLPRLNLQPYLFGALNTSGDTSYAAAGLSLKFGDAIYVRPGLGIAVHNGSADDFNRTDKIAFGSRVLFEPEIGVGARLSDRLSAEASWVHMSHATLFSHQNPGIDNIGVRLNLAL